MSRKENEITNTANVLLPLILIIEYLSSVVSKWAGFLNICAVLAVLFLFVRYIFVRNIHVLDFFFIVFTLLLIAITRDVSRISIFCVYVLFSIRNYYDIKTIKNCLVATVVCLSVIVLCYLLFGFNKQFDTQIYRPLLGTTVQRMCFGFVHPNQFSIYLLALTILVYLYTNRFVYYTLITVVDFVFFSLTQSRTILYVILFVYIVTAVVRLLKGKNVKFHWLMPTVFIFFMVISLVLSLYFAGSKLDVILTGRLALNKKYLEQGVTLFGSNSFDGLPFDNSYIHMLLTKGVVYLLVYYAMVSYYLYKTEFSWKNVILITAIFLEAFMEVIFLKFCFMIIIPIICSNRLKQKYGTENSSLLLVRKRQEV